MQHFGFAKQRRFGRGFTAFLPGGVVADPEIFTTDSDTIEVVATPTTDLTSTATFTTDADTIEVTGV